MRIATSVEIAAPAAVVWNVLADLPRYGDWNPLIPGALGTLAEGQSLVLDLRPPGLMPGRFRVSVLRVVPEKEIRWLGKMFVRGLRDGDHFLGIEPLGPNRSRLAHEEEFTGLLVPLFIPFLKGGMRRGFESMNEALKDRCEREWRRRSSEDKQ